MTATHTIDTYGGQIDVRDVTPLRSDPRVATSVVVEDRRGDPYDDRTRFTPGARVFCARKQISRKEA